MNKSFKLVTVSGSSVLNITFSTALFYYYYYQPQTGLFELENWVNTVLIESEILAVVIFTIKNDDTANIHYYKRNVPAKYHCRKSGRLDQGIQ